MYPLPGATVTGDSISSRWSNPGNGVFAYRIQVAMDSAFATAATDSGVIDTAKSIWHPAGNGRYYWRVQARNLAGWGPWSETRWFDVNNPVTAVRPAPAADKARRLPPGMVAPDPPWSTSRVEIAAACRSATNPDRPPRDFP